MKIDRKKIGLDFDCILATTTQTWIDLYNRLTGQNVELEDIKEWNISKAVLPEHSELIFDLLFNKNLWRSIQPLPESQYYVSLLCKEYDVYVITNSHWETWSAKMEWLIKQYPFIDTHKVWVGAEKQMFGVDLLIDDYENNLINGHYSKILLDYPWNRNINDKEFGILRAYNWKEIYDYTKMLLPTE
jgi:5'(3')-deoxyribonucleotidase